MKRLLTLGLALVASGLLVASGIAAETPAKPEKPAHKFVGAKKCKICHKAEYNAWLETPHAKAYDKLSDAEKKKPECVKCHITGTSEKDVLLEGVQCEACHGAGKDYKSPKIMSKKKWKADPEGQLKLAKAAGLIFPPEEKDCTWCHTKEGNTHFKPFDFEKRKGLVHPTKAKEAPKSK